MTRFTSNHLEVTVEAPPGEAVWLYYADVWHPAWRATVDGMESRVYRANLAYKAVALHPGRNRVHFHFDLSGLAWIELGLGLVAVGWITMILGMSGAIMRDPAWGGPPELPRLSLAVDRDDRG